MKILKSTVKQTLLDPNDPTSVVVHGDQVWQLWREKKLIVNVVRMANPTLSIRNHSVSIDSSIHISWEMESSVPTASLLVACVFTFEIVGAGKVRHYDVTIAVS